MWPLFIFCNKRRNKNLLCFCVIFYTLCFVKCFITKIKWKPKKKKKEQQEEKRVQKDEASISSLWGNFKQSNIRIVGVQEGEEKKQEIGNLSEKLIKENFSNLVKEIDMQGQEAQSPKQDACKETHSKTRYN